MTEKNRTRKSAYDVSALNRSHLLLFSRFSKALASEHV